jgi:hypothetical protein
METAVPAARVKNLFSVPLAQPPPDAGPEVNKAQPLPPPEPNRLPPEPDEVAREASPPALSDEPARPAGYGVGDVYLEIGPLLPLDMPVPAGEAPPKEAPPRPKPAAPRKMRAIGLKGAIILSQDGVNVNFRKKCSKCSFEEPARSTQHISQGVVRVNFYCPKCRKSQDVQIQGVMQ